MTKSAISGGFVHICRISSKTSFSSNCLLCYSMVFERDNETLNDKNLDDKIDVKIKYRPNTLRNKKKDKNFVNKNYDDTKTPLHTELETECMVDQGSSDNSSSDICFDESQPIIS